VVIVRGYEAHEQARTIEVSTVINALERLRQARPLGTDHPLTHLISLRAPSPSWPPSAVSRDWAVYDGLSRLIAHRLARQRRLCGLTGDLRCTEHGLLLERLRADFACGNAELEAWSLLYHRYVRVDLDLTLEQICGHVSLTARTLSRRRHLGAVRLTHLLIRREMSARRIRRLDVIHARLPGALPPELFGRDAVLNVAVQRLTDGWPPRHLALCGQRGVGTTTLALAIAHCLTQTDMSFDVAWIAHPPFSLEPLLAELRRQFGCEDLALYLQHTAALVVVDEAQCFLDNSTQLTALRWELRSARLLLCAQTVPETAADLACLYIPPLDKIDAFALLERQAQTLHLRSDVLIDHFDRLFNAYGGNPGALTAALSQNAVSAFMKH
jgi:hypothetical protein